VIRWTPEDEPCASVYAVADEALRLKYVRNELCRMNQPTQSGFMTL
jgi:hypothetical protein